MSFTELLKAQGLTEEKVTALIASMKAEKVFVAEGEDPAAKLKELQEQAAAKAATEAGSDEKEAEIQKLLGVISRTKIEGKLIQALTKEKAGDIDYLMYKLEKSGAIDKITLANDGKLEGAAEAIEKLKADHADQFSAARHEGVSPEAKKYDVKTLEGTEGKELKGSLTIEEAVAQHYAPEAAKS